MASLIPFNRRDNSLIGYNDFYNMLDDFFSDNLLQNRSLMKDTFKLDIKETEKAYLVEAELPGIKKNEIDLGIEDENLCITVNRAEEVNADEKNFIHRERRSSSMCRHIYLANANLSDITAKLEDGVLTVSVPKVEKAVTSRKIDIE